MPARRKPTDALSKAETIGPEPLPPVTEAGVPSGKSSLWQVMNVARRGMPSDMQELVKFLPLASQDKMGHGVPTLAQIKALLESFGKK